MHAPLAPPTILRRGAPLVLALVAGACGGEPADAPRRRDVVLIVVDTLRADHLGCYGYERGTSPNLDRLAAEGAVFEDVVASSSFTGPSVASILTGKYPRFTTFGFANRGALLAEGEETLAERFAAAGYRTAAVISNPVLPAEFGFGQGFEVYDQEMRQRERVRRAPERVARSASNAALAWLRALGDADSFFLLLHFMDPHGPYTPPAAFRERFAFDDPGPVLAPPPGDQENSGFGFVPWYQAIEDEHRLGTYVGRYDAEIAFFDHHLGRVLDWLRESGRYEDALVLLTSDHGEALGEHGFYFAHGHGVTRDQTFVPLLLKHPDLVPGTRVDAPVGHVDVYPTLASELGGDGAAPGGDGHSLLELARGGVGARVLFCDVGHSLGVRSDRHLLVGSVPSYMGDAPGPDELAVRFVADVDLDPDAEAHDVSARRSLLQYAQRYLEREPARFARREDDADFDETLNALGYTGD